MPVTACPGFEAESRAGANEGRRSVRVGISYGGRASAEELWPFVEAIEDSGFDSLWLPAAPAVGGLAPLPVLAAVAARTDRLKLGVNVLVLPPRNPLTLARELATVDALSGGRLLPPVGWAHSDRPRRHAHR